MLTEAQRRANKNYRERKRSAGEYRTMLLEFYSSDMEIYEFLRTKKPTATYIKDLIREDMGRGNDVPQ